MFDTHILRNLSGRRLIRLYLLILPALFTLAWATHSDATPSGLQQPSTDSPFPVTEAGSEAVPGISRVPGPVSGAGVKVANDRPENLTGFFVIGMIINVLLIALFLIWAVGQWRKTKK